MGADVTTESKRGDAVPRGTTLASHSLDPAHGYVLKNWGRFFIKTVISGFLIFFTLEIWPTCAHALTGQQGPEQQQPLLGMLGTPSFQGVEFAAT